MGHGGGGSERWLVSYADFITLLMVLFVVLYSMGQIDVLRYKELAESLRAAFLGGPVLIVDPGISQGGSGTGETAPSPIIISEIPQRPPDTLDIASRITDMLVAAELPGEIIVNENIEGTLISISQKLLFESGSAELRPSAIPVLQDVAEMIAPLPNQIHVVGHTDNTQPGEPNHPSNWALSTARAVSIVEYFIEAGIAPERLTASGRAGFDPIYSNDTEEHRALNRRADIIIVYPVESQIFDLGIDVDLLDHLTSGPMDPGGETNP